MKVTVDVDIGTVPLPDVLGHLKPEDWTNIATQVVVRLYNDPAAWPALVDAEMNAEHAAWLGLSQAAREVGPEWLKATYRYSYGNQKPEDRHEWRQERTRRIGLNPIAKALAEARDRISALVNEQVRDLINGDEKIQAAVKSAVAVVDVERLIASGIQDAFRYHVANAVTRDGTSRQD